MVLCRSLNPSTSTHTTVRCVAGATPPIPTPRAPSQFRACCEGADLWPHCRHLQGGYGRQALPTTKNLIAQHRWQSSGQALRPCRCTTVCTCICTGSLALTDQNGSRLPSTQQMGPNTMKTSLLLDLSS